MCGKQLLIKVSLFKHKNHFTVIRIGNVILSRTNESLVNTQYDTKYVNRHGGIVDEDGKYS